MVELALFPLNLVVFPEENLNLHIFEPRYRQLIKDCIQESITFGIPAFIDNQVQRLGVEVALVQVVKQYEDGRMDIRTQGKRIFHLQEFTNPMQGKLYAGGKVSFWEAQEDESNMLQKLTVMELIQQLYEVLNVEAGIEDAQQKFLSYKVAHKIGLSLAQEYELLTITTESARLEYLKEHLEKSIPIVREMEIAKERIRLNGHFKNLDALKF